MHGIKISNEYSQAFGRLYFATPKSVFAAIVYSYVSTGGDHPENALETFLHEWKVLHANGIVPQAPPVAAPLRKRYTASEKQALEAHYYKMGREAYENGAPKEPPARVGKP